MSAVVEKKFWTIQDLAERFELHPNTIRNMANDGRLPKPLRFGGGKYLWPKEEFEEFLARLQENAG